MKQEYIIALRTYHKSSKDDEYWIDRSVIVYASSIVGAKRIANSGLRRGTLISPLQLRFQSEPHRSELIAISQVQYRFRKR